MMMTEKDLLSIARNVEKHQDGIYYSKEPDAISYPEEGNERCMQIERDSFWFNHRNNIITQAVKHFNGSSTFFDIGGGNGFVSKGLQEAGCNVVLVEPGVNGAKNAASRNINYIICSTIESAGFEESSMQSAGLFDVVEHIDNDIQFLKNINTQLVNNGLVYITVPAFNFLWSNEDVDAGHYRRYTLKEMNAILEKTGFSIEYSTYIFSILPLPIFLSRSIPSKLGFNKKSDDLNKHQKEHQGKKGIVDNLLQRVWKWEVARVKRLKRIPFGGSCFVVARKIS